MCKSGLTEGTCDSSPRRPHTCLSHNYPSARGDSSRNRHATATPKVRGPLSGHRHLLPQEETQLAITDADLVSMFMMTTEILYFKLYRVCEIFSDVTPCSPVEVY
jgi:hypothetical protein